MKSKSNSVTDLKEAIDQFAAHHEAVLLGTITYDANTDKYSVERVNPTTPRLEFQFHKLGLEYVNYVLTRANRQNKGQIHMERGEGRADLIRQFVAADRQFVFALSTKMELVGCMAHYNPISNAEVFKMVSGNGMIDLMDSFSVRETGMEIRLRSKHVVDGAHNSKFGIVISNGETGHTALSFSSWWEIDGFEIRLPFKGYTRHLSTVNGTYENVQEILEAGVEAEWLLDMQALPLTIFTDLWNELRKTVSARAVEAIDAELAKCTTFLDAASAIGRLTQIKGIKTVANRLMGLVEKQIPAVAAI